MNAWYEILKAKITYLFQCFNFYEQLKFYVQLSWAWKSFMMMETSPTKASLAHGNNL